MTKNALLLVTALLGATLRAGGETGRPATADRGDLTIADIGDSVVTSRKWVSLTTNATYQVVCQVIYDDLLNPAPADPEEIRRARKADNCINIALREFIQENCRGMTANELVTAYRAGYMRKIVKEDFALWFAEYANALNERNGMVIDVDIKAVSMHAVGAFAYAISK